MELKRMLAIYRRALLEVKSIANLWVYLVVDQCCFLRPEQENSLGPLIGGSWDVRSVFSSRGFLGIYNQSRDSMSTQTELFMNGGLSIRNDHRYLRIMSSPFYRLCKDIRNLLVYGRNMLMLYSGSWDSCQLCMNHACIWVWLTGHEYFLNVRWMTSRLLPRMLRRRTYCWICWIKNWPFQLNVRAS